jgi:hypothetical protein
MHPIRRLSRVFRRVLAAIHLIRGRRLYRSGQFALASERVQYALALGGPSFGAHLVLGKIYMRLSRFDRARREFALARYLDPVRFATEGLPEDVLLELAQRFYQPLWEEPVNGAVIAPLRGPRASGSGARNAAHDDFVSPAERERFRVLPPIARDEIDGIDWSRARDLFDG